ncbi:hypothetical protein AB1Y20_015814 [Prymnesium parvum]|uniref:Pentacotripeptide-repeat region of PRORP domain-containing protein n=1 Tax=Prymnesium parvum TaxID=97485 RepID=A0AB34K214_PRYPA
MAGRLLAGRAAAMLPSGRAVLPALHARWSSGSTPFTLTERAAALQRQLAQEHRLASPPESPPPAPPSPQFPPEVLAEWLLAFDAALRDPSARRAADALLLLDGASATESECITALRLCAEAKNGAMALALLERLVAVGHPPRLRAVEHAVRACAAAGDVERMWQCFALAERHAVELHPRVLKYGFQTCRRAEDRGASERLWARMRRAALLPCGVGLRHVVAQCAEAGEWRVGVQKLREMAEAGGRTSAIHWSAVIAGAIRDRQLEEAEALLDELPPYERDPSPFNAVLNGYSALWASGRLETERIANAEALLQRMAARQVLPDVTTYSTLIKLHVFNVQRVEQLLAEMQAAGIERDINVYAHASKAFLFSKRTADADALMHAMREAGIVPNAWFYQATITAAHSVGLLDYADALYRRAVGNGIKL